MICWNLNRTFAVLGNFKVRWEFMTHNDDKLYSEKLNWNKMSLINIVTNDLQNISKSQNC